MDNSHLTASSPAPNPTRPFTPTERIKELNDIDESIAQLLQAAGKALQLIGSNSPATNLVSAKSQFLTSVTTYFTILSSIDVRLRRQVYALQETELITEGDAKDAKRGASAVGAVGAGIGAQLEGSWLSSGGDEVEREIKREVWKKARIFVETMRRGRDGQDRMEWDGETRGSNGKEEHNKQEAMEDTDMRQSMEV